VAASPRQLGLLIAVVAMVVPVGASASEHRSRAVAREFQREHPPPSTGLTIGPCPSYRKDDIVPLACGGPGAVSNMQWQTVAGARAKDAWERKALRSLGPLCRAARSGSR
jgi:hypothetical protein